jgi:hypothetical protein
LGYGAAIDIEARNKTEEERQTELATGAAEGPDYGAHRQPRAEVNDEKTQNQMDNEVKLSEQATQIDRDVCPVLDRR